VFDAGVASMRVVLRTGTGWAMRRNRDLRLWRYARAILAAFGLGSALLQGGCASLFGPDIDDVALVSVEIVSAAPDGDPGLQRYFTRHRDGALVKVRLSTKADLAKLQRDAVYLHSTGSLCPLGTGPKFGEWPGIFEIYEGRTIDVDALAEIYRRDPDAEKTNRENGVSAYDVFFPPSRPNREVSGVYGEPDLEPYDLAATPHDVCLQITGAAYPFFNRVNSNVVIVPREALESALRRRRAEGVSQLVSNESGR
jgi:hypothetical protein